LSALKRSKQLRSSVAFLDELGFSHGFVTEEPEHFDELLVDAAEEAMADSGLSRAQIGTLFLYSGLNPQPRGARAAVILERFRYPVAKLADQLELPHVNAMALSQQGCSGLLSAINLAARTVETGDSPAALCVAGDALPKNANREIMYNVMSDAAVAVVVERRSPRNQIVSFHQLGQPAYWDSPQRERELVAAYFPMAQRAICAALEQAGLRLSDIRWIVPSNVSLRSWTILAQLLRIPVSRIWSKNIARVGHTVCCDHVINLRDMSQEGALTRGDHLLLFTFGFGASWTTLILQH